MQKKTLEISAKESLWVDIRTEKVHKIAKTQQFIQMETIQFEFNFKLGTFDIFEQVWMTTSYL